MSTLKFNVKQLIRRLELEKNQDYKIQDIAELSGINRFTLSGIIGNSNVRVDLSTLAKLVDFFREEGLNIGPGDLFEITVSDNLSASDIATLTVDPADFPPPLRNEP